MDKPVGPENQKVRVTIGGCERPSPPTTEWHGRKQQPATMEPMSVFVFFSFMFCFFCLGVAIGGYICGN